ncbi:hypothetical protein VTN77DRAFT_8406 [Rasamsonia byssochlamydoides]|uniref:uncharacterized protein n=1 Tax=Rasamsonia byssochlamydoides TaxID=89139 RepID=UPI0037427F6E
MRSPPIYPTPCTGPGDFTHGSAMTASYVFPTSKTIIDDVIARPEPHKAKPTIVVTPPNLVYQWAEEIAAFCPQFEVYIYFGSSRQAPPVDCKEVLDILENDHELFDGAPSRNWSIRPLRSSSLPYRYALLPR